MHAIIPVAGMGTRLRPITHTTPKALIPVAGRPVLGHIIDRLIPAGVDRLTLVVGHLGDAIVSWVRSSSLSTSGSSDRNRWTGWHRP